MKKARIVLWCAYALAAAVLALRLLLFVKMTKTDTPSGARAHAHAPQSTAVGSVLPPESLLFPDLGRQRVTAITISTPERSFHFLCEDPEQIIVNGQHADGEAFLTLLEQIACLPVEMHSAFAVEELEPLLTLVVSFGAQQQTARFYDDGNMGKKTHIVVGSGDASRYGQTGGWRVGTLMMTCEGTRIQDAHGNERPVAAAISE